MGKSVAASVKELFMVALNPLALVSIVSFLLVSSIAYSILEPLFEPFIVFYLTTPFLMDSIILNFGLMFASFPIEITAIIILFLFEVFSGVFIGFYFSFLFKHKNEGKKLMIGKAFSETRGKLRAVVGAWFFMLLLLFFLFAFLDIILSLIPDGFIAAIFLLIYMILALIILFSLALVFPVMAIEEMNLKKAIGKSYKLISKNFFKSVSFIILISIISTTISAIIVLIPVPVEDLELFGLIDLTLIFLALIINGSINWSLAPQLYYMLKE